MSSAFRSALAFLLLAALAVDVHAARELRVCADPDNLPFSNRRGEGFENRIAQLVAGEMGATLAYAWTPPTRGFVRKTLGAGACDVLVGVPARFEHVLATHPYYRSSYVFVSRGPRAIRSFDDPRLLRVSVGVQLVGDDLAATPPGHALAARGAIANVRGFTVMGDAPAAARMVAALDAGELDTALIWGPQAGYFAARAATPLQVTVARPPDEANEQPFEFAISMGVARGDAALRDELDEILARRAADIDTILADYHVPRTDRP